MTHSITAPHVGGRVFTERGLQKHGPFDAPHLLVDVDPGTYGIIERVDPYRSFDPLYFVKWEGGQISGHYPRDFNGKLLCIGPFKNLDGLRNAFKNSKLNSVTVQGHSNSRLESLCMDIGGESISAPLVWSQGDERLFELCDKELWNLIQRIHQFFVSHRSTAKHLETYLRPLIAEYTAIAAEPEEKCCSWPKKLCKHKKAKEELPRLLKQCKSSEARISSLGIFEPLKVVIEFSDCDGTKAKINLDALCSGQFDLEVFRAFNGVG